MAAASGEKDGFPLGPQLFCRFAGARCGGLGARSSANPYYSVPFVPSPAHFSLLRPVGGRVPLIFVYVHKEFVLFCVHDLFFIAFHKFLSII